MKNKIPDRVIVSISYPTQAFSCDAELPTQMPISQIKRGLRKLLKNTYPKLFFKLESVELIYNDEKLSDDKTLAFYGIWDGSPIEIKDGFDNIPGKIYLSGR